MRIGDYIINTKNITYVSSEVRGSNGYIWKKNITLTIHLIGGEKIEFVYYEADLEQYKKRIAELEKILSDDSVVEVLE